LNSHILILFIWSTDYFTVLDIYTITLKEMNMMCWVLARHSQDPHLQGPPFPGAYRQGCIWGGRLEGWIPCTKSRPPENFLWHVVGVSILTPSPLIIPLTLLGSIAPSKFKLGINWTGSTAWTRSVSRSSYLRCTTNFWTGSTEREFKPWPM